MIIHANQRGGGRQMALHLENTETNEHVEVYEVSGFVSDNILGALNEAYAISKATKCKQFMYSASFNPPQDENVPVETFIDAINRAEKKLKLLGQPRIIVFHEKESRRHAHCVWSRIDADSMTAINISHPKLKLMSLSKELFHEQGWDMPQGFIDRKLSNPLNFTRAEWEQAQRTKQSPNAIKEALRDAWQLSDSAKALEYALQDRGYYLARGDRRSFVVVDLYGEVYSLPRKIGLKKADIEARLGSPEKLRSVDETKELISSRLTKQFVEFNKNLKSEQKRELNSLDTKKRVMRDAHRAARAILAEQHETKGQESEIVRSARVRRGYKGLWDKLTGSYQRTRLKNELETQQQQRQREVENHRLITDQLNERNGLQRQYIEVRQRHENERASFAKGVNKHFHEIELQDEIKEVFQEQTTSQAQAPLSEEFNENLEEYLSADPEQRLVIPVDPEQLTLRERVKRSPDAIIEAITDKQENFTRHDISRALGKFIHDDEKLAAATEQVLVSKQLVKIEGSQTPIYSTHEMQAVKAAIKDHAQEMDATKGYGTSKSHINWTIKKHNDALQKKVGANLSDEQCGAIRHLLNEQQLNIAVGLAGTGKSTLLAATNDACVIPPKNNRSFK